MTPGARLAAAAGVLDAVLAGEPAERALLGWARGARYAGSKDRAAVRDLVFEALRRRRSQAWVGGSETGRGLVLGGLRLAGADPALLMTGEGHALSPPDPDEDGRDLGQAPEGVRLDLPDWLLAAWRASLGEAAEAAALTLRDRAAVHLRVNARRATAESAARALVAEGVATEPIPGLPDGLTVTAGAGRVSRTAAYAEGAVELQDGSSQAAVLRLPLADGMRVLDLCAGGGGKSLAMGARADLKLFAWDAEPRRMVDLLPRASRAGLAVAIPDRPEEAAPYDLVLVDAPCSGSGTWRRTPDAKWRLTADRLVTLEEVQSGLLDRAAALVGSGGVLAYSTCSLLDGEGPAQIDAFLSRSPGWREEDRQRWLPSTGGDGFFLSVLRRA